MRQVPVLEATAGIGTPSLSSRLNFHAQPGLTYPHAHSGLTNCQRTWLELLGRSFNGCDDHWRQNGQRWTREHCSEEVGVVEVITVTRWSSRRSARVCMSDGGYRFGVVNPLFALPDNVTFDEKRRAERRMRR